MIRIRGARVHNLRDIDVDIPRNRLVVFTGPSGSGKSSLALDTIFAEGQRQYIETLSVYARQFLHQAERPDLDWIDGLQPTVCIDQRRGNHNPRSTVATVTEVYDYLRVLMARLGTPHCYECGRAIQQQTPQRICDCLLQLGEGTRVMLLAPLVRGRKGAHRDILAKIRKLGLIRVRIDGDVLDMDQVTELTPHKDHDIEAVVDRIVIRSGIRTRLMESLDLAIRNSDGLVLACHFAGDPAADQWQEVLFSTRHACPHCGISYAELEPRTFSFNSPYGVCKRCEGLGRCLAFDPELVLPDQSRSLADGAVMPWRDQPAAEVARHLGPIADFLRKHAASLNVPLADLSDPVCHALVHGEQTQEGFPGILLLLEKELATTTNRKRIATLESYRVSLQCPDCGGSRLRREANCVRLGEKSMGQLTAMPAVDARSFIMSLDFPAADRPIARPLVHEITQRLAFLDQVGVGYLTLDRPADTLSGGELQRVRLATNVGSGMVGVCYVLDEPSIGLHPRDNQRLIESLCRLRDEGNSVLVVEHDETIMRHADHLIDIGPGAGDLGGRIVCQGSVAKIVQDPGSITGQYLSGKQAIQVPVERRRVAKSRAIFLHGVATNNLKNIDVMFPLGVFVCVTGVSGSGKSSLVNETLAPALLRRLGNTAPKAGPYTSLKGVRQIDKVIQIDQSPIGRSPRSNPATYVGVFDEIRKVFAATREARQRGFQTRRFSFNVKGGRCETCQGQGTTKIEMNFLPDLYVTCSQCKGARFNRQTLQIRFHDQSIAQVLDMSVSQAADFFQSIPAIAGPLASLQAVGLGYLHLGQPCTTLSGGEAQRVKLATQLARVETGKTLYLLDEPTTGLHFDDVRRLLDVLNQLVDRGNTVLVIEHHLDVIKTADWVIDLGPEGGEQGGFVTAVGPPEQIAAAAASHTGRYLRTVLPA